jgi:hypothetical protein
MEEKGRSSSRPYFGLLYRYQMTVVSVVLHTEELKEKTWRSATSSATNPA